MSARTTPLPQKVLAPGSWQSLKRAAYIERQRADQYQKLADRARQLAKDLEAQSRKTRKRKSNADGYESIRKWRAARRKEKRLADKARIEAEHASH